MPETHAITVGTFDGVHLGHRALIARARQLVGGGGRVTALVFEPNPAAVLRPQTASLRLTMWDQRERLLREAGADEVVRLAPTEALLESSPREFLDGIVREHGPSAIVEGPDFRFGRKRSGDAATLVGLGQEMGFAAEIVEPVEAVLTDDTLVPARSTVVRWLVGHGRVRDAARVLGRPHACEGVVVRGARRGRELGYPTANIESPCMAPAAGVYAGEAVLEDGRTYGAAVAVGHAPMFDDAPGVLEAYLLDAPTEEGEDGARVIQGLPEYGWRVELRLLGWIREQLKFESVGALLEQMGRDCERARGIIERTRREGGSAGMPAEECLT